MGSQEFIEIPKHNITPFLVPKSEVPLAVLQLKKIKPGASIAFLLEIGWGKPPGLDLGELEIILRKQSESGQELLRSYEMCHTASYTKLEHTETAVNKEETYFLLACSPDGKAYIDGPIRMKATVF